jgi:hypothetical protein
MRKIWVSRGTSLLWTVVSILPVSVWANDAGVEKASSSLLMDIEPPIEPVANGFVWLEALGGWLLGIAMLALLIWLARRLLPGEKRRWQVRQWQKACAENRWNEAARQAFALNVYKRIQKWPLTGSRLESWEVWAFSPNAPSQEAMCSALKDLQSALSKQRLDWKGLRK